VQPHGRAATVFGEQTDEVLPEFGLSPEERSWH